MVHNGGFSIGFLALMPQASIRIRLFSYQVLEVTCSDRTGLPPVGDGFGLYMLCNVQYDNSDSFLYSTVAMHSSKTPNQQSYRYSPSAENEILLVGRRVLSKHRVLARCKLRITFYRVGWLVYLI